MTQQDNYGFFGPEYSFADNIPLPGQIGVRREPSFGAIIDSVGGINYYVDTIAFGGRTFFDQHDPKPMGIRYFLNTDMRCSNGATMSDYFDGVTRGDLLGDHVAKALASTGLPGLKGLAPGMLESARDALDPRPILSAVTGTGYPVCQQVACPVGDSAGSIQNAQDATKPYIVDPVQYGTVGMQGPTQTRWVQAYDPKTGAPLSVSKDEFGATPKCYNADGTYMDKPPDGCGPPAVKAKQGTGKFGLCKVLQPARVEGFCNEQAQPIEDYGILACIAVLGGVALYSVTRKS
jgi:hypothetical protein